MKKYKVVIRNCNQHAFTVISNSRLNAAKVGAISKLLSLRKFLSIYTIEKEVI